MKEIEKEKAIKFRKDGISIKEIAKKLSVSNSSVSNWVRDIKLSEQQTRNLYKNMHSRSTIEKRRISRLKNESTKRDEIIRKSRTEISTEIGIEQLKVIGCMLYWAEGGKKQRSMVRFSNSDPQMIELMMRFFVEICKVEKEKFKGHIHTHSKTNIGTAENYWSEISKIPKRNFFKTYCKKSVSSKDKRHSLPYGTFDIYVCDTKLFLTIKGWTEGVIEFFLKTN